MEFLREKNIHILETSLSVMVRIGMPLLYWSYGFQVAFYLINRLPYWILGNISPFQLLYKNKPAYSHLKVFGCLCYPFTRPYLNTKLYLMSIRYVFLGYPLLQKGYLCLDIASKKINTTPYAVFNEEYFPFLQLSYIVSQFSLSSHLSSQPTPVHFVHIPQTNDQPKIIYNVF